MCKKRENEKEYKIKWINRELVLNWYKRVFRVSAKKAAVIDDTMKKFVK